MAIQRRKIHPANAGLSPAEFDEKYVAGAKVRKAQEDPTAKAIAAAQRDLERVRKIIAHKEAIISRLKAREHALVSALENLMPDGPNEQGQGQ